MRMKQFSLLLEKDLLSYKRQESVNSFPPLNQQHWLSARLTIDPPSHNMHSDPTPLFGIALEVTLRTTSWMFCHRGQSCFIHEGPIRKSIGVTFVVGSDDGISHVDHFRLL